jgi:putative phage-type endonuclease
MTEATARTPERAEFHRLRAQGIGGSDVAAILGLDRYRTPEQVWLEKTGQVKPIDTMTPDQERGITFESIALERFQKATGMAVIRSGGRFQHPVHKFMLANIDAIVDGRPIIVEVKCPSLGAYSRIKREGLPDSWLLQMQHYMAVTSFDYAIIVIFCADRMELLHFTVERDQGLIDNMIEKETEFWTLVETMTPPPDVISEIRGQEIVVVGSVTKRSDVEFTQAMQFLREAKALVKTAAQAEDDAKERFVEVVGDHTGIYEVEGLGRVHYKDREGRQFFDHKSLAGARPLDRLTVGAILQPYFEAKSLPDAVFQELGKADIDLTKFEKKGAPYRELRAYFGKGDE